MKKNHFDIIFVLALIGVLCLPLLMPSTSFAGGSSDLLLITVVIGLAAILVMLYAVMWKLKPWK